jgi:phosphinothricin acetyltransferase
MRRRIAATLPIYPWLVCERAGSIAGYAYASRHREREAYRWSVDVAVYVHPDRRHAGVGRALYTSLLGLLRFQGFYNAFAGIALPNPASVGLHETMGFRQLGIYRNVGFKCGAWQDVGWWQLPLQLQYGEPGPPIDYSQLRAGPLDARAFETGMACLRDVGCRR